ncbi:thiamine pyrophosphate-dependent enzyme [Brevibacterium casei]|uniref:thiamine pyrophosphate-dependent enzyme n=1 Tax=Brevibacterium casei TaxID=33889 RepID=UPI000E65A425|nr:thiamine pyrophosphate-dependent enzyme [Brevibacterium casei]
MTELTGGGHLAKALAAEGVTRVFGIPGTHNLEVFARLSAEGIDIVSPRHEQGAGYMPDGAARTTGDVAVVVTTTGPAVLNALTALLQSFTDSVPVLLIGPGMPLTHPGRGNGLLHEVRNQALAIEAILGDSHRVTSVPEVSLAVGQALTVMRSGRPRPAFIEIPLDLIEASGPGVLHPSVTRPLPQVSVSAIESAAEALGAGIVLSSNAKGAVADDHPVVLGAIGFLPELPEILGQADAVVAIGTELAPSDFWPQPLPLPGTVVRIDIDEMQMLRNAVVTHPIVADAKEATAALTAQAGRVREAGSTDAARSWRVGLRDEAIAAAREGAPWAPLCEGLNAFTALSESPVVIAADSTMACYYGVQTGWRARHGDRFLYPAGAGTLGYGLPAGIGAKIAAPESRVIAVEGDGGSMFTIAELSAAVQAQVSLTLVIVDNGGYGEIRNEMADRGDVPSGVVLTAPDFPALATAMGAHGVHVESAEELAAALAEAVERPGPTLIHLFEDSRAAADMLGP